MVGYSYLLYMLPRLACWLIFKEDIGEMLGFTI